VRVIGQRYELSAEIAAGGMATVHLARQIGAAGFARIVAVKRLHERYAHDPDFVAMFLDEARLVARIRHPNVVSTIDVVVETDAYTDGGQHTRGRELFIVMEYVHGESLLHLLNSANRTNDSIPPRIIAAILVGILHGLHEAHEARSEMGEPLGVVHRDVSPHNILVGVDGVTRLLDFGVAKASERITSTTEGQLKGKLTYMAPEQARGGMLDRRTDIYAAAVVFWELLTGTKMIQAANEAAVIHQVLCGDLRAPSTENPLVPAAIDAVVMRGLARDPAQRFPTARDMIYAIEEATGGSGGVASVAEVRSWVLATCGPDIDKRAQMIASIEVASSSRNLREAAASIESISRRVSSNSAPTIAPGYRPLSSPIAAFRSFPPIETSTPSSASVALPSKSSSSHVALLATLLGTLIGALAIGVCVFFFAARRAAPPKAFQAAVSATPAAATPTTPPPIACPAGMVAITGGPFFMGSDEDLAAEKPAHKVTLRPYCMDKTEVTAAAYLACSTRGECKRAGTSNRWEGISAKEQKTYDPLCTFDKEGRGDHPINCVDWANADRFCKANGKRLPTEAEWELAARGSDGRKYPWGDAAPTAKHLNACGTECVSWLKKKNAMTAGDGFLYAADDGHPTTAPVGSFPLGASKWGVDDIVGNVWEWVSDYFGSYSADDLSNPTGPASGKERVIRGGSWNGAYADWVRPSFRYMSPPETRSHGIGFRCAKTL